MRPSDLAPATAPALPLVTPDFPAQQLQSLCPIRTLPALPIPRERVLDTNGAGDVFHGAYVYSYLSNPGKSWHDHFDFARAASTYKIQRLGNEAGLPTLSDIEAVRQEFGVRV